MLKQSVPNPPSLRIAYLTGEYLRPTHTFMHREVAALRAYGVEVHTFSIRATDPADLVSPEQLQEAPGTYNIFPVRPIKLIKAHISLLLKAPKRYWKSLLLAWQSRSPGLKALLYQLFYFIEAGILAQELRQRKIQHLHNHFADSSCTVAMLAATMADLRFSFTLHGPYIFFEPYRWRLDLKIQQALFVVCISHYCRSQAMLFSTSDNWEKLHIVHCGIELNRYQPVVQPSHQKRLLYVGRLSAAKGVAVLFQAVASVLVQHPETVLTIVGDGPDRRTLEMLAADLGITHALKFDGYQAQSAVCQYLQDCEVFVLPSFAEGLPVVLMEAMATGRPVVTTTVAAISELVKDGVSGHLVPPGDAASLAEKIDKLLRDPSLRQSFGQAGRHQVQQAFNVQQEAAVLKDIFSAAVGGQSA